MSNVLFLQFYSKRKKNKGSEFTLNNGFSDALLECKNRGDLIWYEHNLDETKYYLENEYPIQTLPISKGIIYISAVYPNHLFQAYLWAKMYPNIQFNVGGPVLFGCEGASDLNTQFLFFNINQKMPSNLYLTGMSVEQLLNIPDYSIPWTLELPKEITFNDSIQFSYTLENQCYYKKCIFCSTTHQLKSQYRSRQHMDLDYEQFSRYKFNTIRLNTGSITPYHIENIIPKLSAGDNIAHYLFIRIVQRDLECLKNTLSKLDVIPNFIIGTGLEFPTERMWRYIKKGFSFKNLLLLSGIRIQAMVGLSSSAVVGWNNLTKQDIIELENNINLIPDEAINAVRMWWLFAHHRTEIFDTYDGRDENSLTVGPFDFGFSVKLNQEQQELNHQAVNIIKNRFKLVKDFSDFTHGMAEI